MSLPNQDIYKKMIHAQKMLGELGIGKEEKNEQQGFQYRGIDALLNTIGPVLAEAGIIALPTVVKMERGSIQVKSGSVWQHVQVTIKYTFYSDDGSRLEAVVEGEGTDPTDKATAKAMTAAYKAVMVQTFSIPVVGKANDGDQIGDDGQQEVITVTESEAVALRSTIDEINAIDKDGQMLEADFTKWLCGVDGFDKLPADQLARAINCLATVHSKRKKAADDAKPAKDGGIK